MENVKKKQRWKILILIGIIGILVIGVIMYKQQLIQVGDIGRNYLKGILEYYTIQENIVPLGNLVNITAETGASNFTHLNISTTAPYDSLVGYWNADGDVNNASGYGTTAYDWSKYNNDGTYKGNANVTDAGKLGKGMSFDGIGDYVSAPVGDDISGATGFTLLAWWKVNILGVVDDAISNWDGAPNNQFLLREDGSGIDCYLHNTTTQIGGDFDDLTLIAGKWHLVACTWNGTTIEAYRDGTKSSTTFRMSGSLHTQSDSIEIGYYNNQYFNGSIDDVMIFNTSLTSAQILAIYNNQSARFLATGTQDIVNQTYMNISTGNNRVNVTTYIESLLGSSINLSVGYYDGIWAYTTPQVVSSGTIQTFNITSTSTNLTLNYTFYAGNSTNPFYSPIIKNNITFDAWNEAGAEDTIYPLFSNEWDDNGSLLDTGIGKFNVTVENTNGTVILHINNTNILATNLTVNVYNASHTFGIGGTYLYNWTAYGNGTSHNLNTSENRYYTVNSSGVANCWTKTGSGRGSVLFIPRGCVYETKIGELG